MATVNHNQFGQAAVALGAETLTVDEKLALISRNLDEVCKRELMSDILTKEKRDIKIYWGTATTGKPHVAYFVPMSKIADFLRAGCEVTILFADIHGYLDNMKSTFELLKYRTEYYKAVISATLKSIGVPLDKLKFTTGSSYQLTPEFTLDILKLTTICSQRDAQKAGAEVVKQSESPPLSGLLYPIYQWLDEEYLGVDAQFGGVDQRKIFMGAEKYLPKIGYKQRSHLMNPMVPGLTGEKMSSSEVDSKIDLIDAAGAVKKKINKVFCEEGNIEKNPLLAFVKSVVFLVRGAFSLLSRDAEPIVYTDYKVLETDFASGKIHPGDMKNSVIQVLNSLLEPIREVFRDPKLVELSELAYPTEKPAKAQKAGGKGKSAKGGKAGGKAPAVAVAGEPQSAEVDVSRLLMKVGKIVSIEQHPNADSMYLEKIDVGGDAPLQVVSGLVGKIAMEELKDRMVVIVCNLKPANLRSIKSFAMLLCASDESGKTECLDPPAGSIIGERVTVAGFPGAAEDVIKPGKKGAQNSWDIVQPDLRIADDLSATFKGDALITSAGPVTVKSLKLANIK